MRSKTGNVRKKRHKKVIKKAKGYRMTRSRLFKMAQEAALHAGQYAFHGRKLRKRDFRRLWIQRINAALNSQSLKYSRFIHLLEKNNINLNRKMLADLALNHPNHFNNLVAKVK